MTEDPNWARWVLGGRADVVSAAELLAQARELAARERNVRVDASAVTQVDVSAVQILVALRRALVDAGRKVELGETSEAMRQALAASGVLESMQPRAGGAT